MLGYTDRDCGEGREVDVLDLHGKRYAEVELLVENFVLSTELPAKIITGNSPAMQAIVCRVLAKHNIGWKYESDYNLGALIVGDW